jgi:hypothetical protein
MTTRTTFLILFFVMACLLHGHVFAETTAEVVTLDNPLGNITTVDALTGNIIKTVLGVMGSLTLLAFVYGAFLWLTSAGEAEKVQTGKNTMLYATIGVFVIFSAYAILATILNLLGTRGG